MDETKWTCARCKKESDLEDGEGWITLVDDEHSYQNGKLTPLAPYETICYECGDEMLCIVEGCDKRCWECEVVAIWGLSIMDCLKFQLKFELINLPQKSQPLKGSLEETKEVLGIFDRF